MDNWPLNPKRSVLPIGSTAGPSFMHGPLATAGSLRESVRKSYEQKTNRVHALGKSRTASTFCFQLLLFCLAGGWHMDSASAQSRYPLPLRPEIDQPSEKLPAFKRSLPKMLLRIAIPGEHRMNSAIVKPETALLQVQSPHAPTQLPLLPIPHTEIENRIAGNRYAENLEPNTRLTLEGTARGSQVTQADSAYAATAERTNPGAALNSQGSPDSDGRRTQQDQTEDAARQVFQEASEGKFPEGETGNFIVDEMLQVMRQSGSISSRLASSRGFADLQSPLDTDPRNETPITPDESKSNRDVKVAEQLLKAARLLEKQPEIGLEEVTLIQQLRAKAGEILVESSGSDSKEGSK